MKGGRKGCYCRIGAGPQEDPAQRGFKRVPDGAAHLGCFVNFPGVEFETVQGVSAVCLRIHIQGGPVAVAEVQEVNRQRQRTAVEGAVVKAVFELVLCFQMEALHHLDHHIGRCEVEDLVVHVHVAGHQAQVREGGLDVAADGVALGVFLDKNGGIAGVDGRGFQDIKGAQAQTDEYGQSKPGETADTHGPEVREGQRLFFLEGVGAIVEG